MSNNTYNGWANRETWLINIWFNPETKEDVLRAKDQLEEDIENLPEYLQDFINDSVIDWDELLAHFEDTDDNEGEN